MVNMLQGHGGFDLKLNGNIMVFTAYGAWNKETAMEFVKAATTVVAPIIESEWAMLSIITHWELSTPDCNPIIKQVVESGVKKGLRCEAIVNTQGVIKMEQFHLSAPSSSTLIRQEFRKIDDALSWLEEQGFKIEK